MARGKNTVSLMGFLSNDAKRIDNVANAFGARFQIACERRTKSGNDWVARTDFVPCVHWRAEKLFPYLTQGKQVMIDGHIETRQITDEATGKTNFLVQVVVDELWLLGEKGDSEQSGEQEAEAKLREDYIAELQRQNEALKAQIEAAAAPARAPAPAPVKTGRNGATAGQKRPAAKGRGK
jgi:single-strand DNA-binding protein